MEKGLTAKQAVLYLVLLTLGLLATGLPTSLVLMIPNDASFLTMLGFVFLLAIAINLSGTIIMRTIRMSLPDQYKLQDLVALPDKRSLLYGALATIEIIAVDWLVAQGASFFTRTNQAVNSQLLVTGVAKANILKVLLLMGVICVISPFLEELFFRGALIARSDKKLRIMTVCASTALFCIVHSPHHNVWSMVIYANMGLVFAYLYTRRFRVTDAIVAHMMANLLGILPVLLMR